ncbi:MAG: N-acetyl-alpha-D-glucosaminyl L-malate synthase BshA [Candidatus Eisenbacteria bacterium]|uniref:N-acetyl-alpha-D-glucosaminyl L-malate synthase BshA n=1 Tax=Eiseniibacteriota bacterium TaxID=2212470 RepID=A0A538T7T1_UNCEI|nr:MAG: N-acetyl-alpha-D-glucosaminyl L-malate synthase BshA [Candidatus Eisenbacteria bacterium]
MKIGITCYPTHGGSGVVATELGMELARRGHEVHFISYALPFRLKRFQENVVFHEVQMLAYPLFQYPPYTLALAAKLAEVADEIQLDVLHAHYAVPHAVCAYLARQVARSTKLKIVTTLHGTDITLVGADPSFRPLTRFGIEQSDGVTAVSRYLKEKTLEVFDLDRQIEVIPNFVDTTRFAPRREGSCPRERFAKKGERVLLHISNFRPSKRVEDVVRVFAAVRREVPGRLLLVGDGPDRVPSREVAEALGVEKWVRWLGQLDAVEDVISLADLFILTSKNESFGLAALEAMSAGVPVIGTTAEGLPELVRSEETGYLLPVGDVEGMARRSIEILSDSKRYAAMSEAARRDAIERFDAQRVIPLYEDFYGRVLGQPVRVPEPFTPPDALA